MVVDLCHQVWGDFLTRPQITDMGCHLGLPGSSGIYASVSPLLKPYLPASEGVTFAFGDLSE